MSAMSDAEAMKREANLQAMTLIEPQGVPACETQSESPPRAQAAAERRATHQAPAPANVETDQTLDRATPSDSAHQDAPDGAYAPAVSPHPYATARAVERNRLEVLRGPRRDTLLYLDGVTKSFDGFKAIDNLSLVVQKGEMRAIIGPNGAGKTTMMDIITGKTRPDKGDVYFAGETDLTQHDEAAIANMGIGRKFQKPTVFESHTIEDNIRLSLTGTRSILHALVHRKDSAERETIDRILETTRLTARRRTLAADLSHGQKQWLEIGMLLAQDPQLLLVDEPVAGMTDAETEETARLLREIAETRSVVVVEHDMHFVRALGVKVTCLHEGKVLSEGTLDHVSADPRVIEVYLGR